MFFVYYFTRGYLVTVLYIRVKLSLSRRDAEHFSANMGAQTIPSSVFFVFIFCVIIFGRFEARAFFGVCLRANRNLLCLTSTVLSFPCPVFCCRSRVSSLQQPPAPSADCVSCHCAQGCAVNLGR